MVMGGLTEEEEVEEEEDQELQEQEAEEEAEATLCWDSRVTSMNSRLTLFVAMVDGIKRSSPGCTMMSL